jgi:predicted DNA-binding transcriptional regulator AlpA
MLGIARSSFCKLMAQGRLPAPVRLGRRVLWPVAELVRWIEAGCPSREVWEQRRSEQTP